MQYSLGPLQAQEGELDAAVKSLQKAALLLPQRGRVAYNLALAYQQKGLAKLAEKSFLDAVKADASDPDVVYALAAFYFHSHQLPKAQRWADRLAQLRPDDPNLTALQRALGQGAARAGARSRERIP